MSLRVLGVEPLKACLVIFELVIALLSVIVAHLVHRRVIAISYLLGIFAW